MKIGIWVVCAERKDVIGKHTKQLLSKASSLLPKKESFITAICIGNYELNDLQSLSIYGVDEVIWSKGGESDYRMSSLMLMNLYEKEIQKPKLIIFLATDLGRCIAADLAIKLKAGLTAECIDIEAEKYNDKYEFCFSRAAVSSTMNAHIHLINTDIGICTIKDNMFVIDERYEPTDIPIREYNVNTNNKSQYFRIVKSELIFNENAQAVLSNSRIVFGLGRGIQDEEGLHLVKQVAKKYNATIVGTRAMVENGFIERKRQVGQSGISISPDIYVAIGISGATQHIVGIKNSKTIIAINTDQMAPIFSYADYCIIDDYKKIFKELI